MCRARSPRRSTCSLRYIFKERWNFLLALVNTQEESIVFKKPNQPILTSLNSPTHIHTFTTRALRMILMLESPSLLLLFHWYMISIHGTPVLQCLFSTLDPIVLISSPYTLHPHSKILPWISVENSSFGTISSPLSNIITPNTFPYSWEISIPDSDRISLTDLNLTLVFVLSPLPSKTTFFPPHKQRLHHRLPPGQWTLDSIHYASTTILQIDYVPGDFTRSTTILLSNHGYLRSPWSRSLPYRASTPLSLNYFSSSCLSPLASPPLPTLRQGPATPSFFPPKPPPPTLKRDFIHSDPKLSYQQATLQLFGLPPPSNDRAPFHIWSWICRSHHPHCPCPRNSFSSLLQHLAARIGLLL